MSKVIDMVEELADSTEGPIAKLIRTDMFPFERPGIAEGGNSPWSTVALPNNPEYQYDVSAPTPDTHFGYPTNQRSGWSYAQSNIITHPVARSYAQPARGNTIPFPMVEMKSEADAGEVEPYVGFQLKPRKQNVTRLDDNLFHIRFNRNC